MEKDDKVQVLDKTYGVWGAAIIKHMGNNVHLQMDALLKVRAHHVMSRCI